MSESFTLSSLNNVLKCEFVGLQGEVVLSSYNGLTNGQMGSGDRQNDKRQSQWLTLLTNMLTNGLKALDYLQLTNFATEYSFGQSTNFERMSLRKNETLTS